MNRIILTILILIGLCTFSILPASAEPLAKDFALSVTLSPSASTINSGDAVTLTYTITNVGTNSLAPILEEYVYLSPELTYQSVSSPDFYLDCPDWYKLDEIGTYNPKYNGYSFAPCFGSEGLTPLSPGGSYSFTVHTIAVSNFIDGTTQAFGFHYPSWFSEDDRSTTLAEFINVADNGGDFATMNTNNLATYTYSAPPAITTTQPAPAGSASGISDTKESSESGSVSNSTLESNAGEALATESKDQLSVSDKAEVAIDKKLNVPDRISQSDKKHPRVGLSEKYKNEAILASIIGFVTAMISYFIRRRYLRTISKQRKFRSTLNVVETSGIS